jgi:hypothetical protein
MQQQRAKLPMAALRQQIAGALAGSDAVVISGETGSGKTTQVRDARNGSVWWLAKGIACSDVLIDVLHSQPTWANPHSDPMMPRCGKTPQSLPVLTQSVITGTCSTCCELDNEGG